VSTDLVQANLELNAAEVRVGRVQLSSAPLQVNIELTGVCNINPPCLFCTGKNFGHNYAPLDPAYLDKYRSFLDRCEHVNEDSFGEPLGHPGLIATARRFIANGQRFSFVTNGLLITRDKADALADLGPKLGMHVSFNAADADVFYKLTGKRFATVVENVRYFVEAYRTRNGGAEPDLILTFIVMKVNRHQVSAFLALVRELGGRALLASLHDRPSVPLGHFGYDFVYEDEMLPYEDLVAIGRAASARASELGVRCLIQWDVERDSAIRGFAEPGVSTPCLIPWRFLFLQQHTGKVFSCPYHRHPTGVLEGGSLEAVWNSEAAQELRSSLAQGQIPRHCLDDATGCPLVMRAREVQALEKVEDSVTVGHNDFGHLVAGWHLLEHVPAPIRWTSQASDFLIRAAGETLCIQAITWGPRPVRVRVELDGMPLGGRHVGNRRWSTLRFRLPPGTTPATVRRGRILTDEAWVPALSGMGSDTRRLGVAVSRIWMESTHISRLRVRLESDIRRVFALFGYPLTAPCQQAGQTRD
jgi:MoaA/NifB/PqqE/SkfB family radical SAM enzyme